VVPEPNSLGAVIVLFSILIRWCIPCKHLT
jgi:hypothetical protein